MALRADREGFLLGERVDIDTRWMASALEIWTAIKRDTGAMLALMAGRRSGVAAQKGLGARAAEVRARPASVAEPVRGAALAAPASNVVPIRPVALQPATPRRPAQTRSAPAVVRQRDEKGRFIAAAEPRRHRSSGNSRPDEDDGAEAAESITRKLASAVADSIKGSSGAAAQGVEQIDPVLGAAKELGDIASPLTSAAKGVGGGLFRSVLDRRERKKQREQAKETAKENIKATIPWYRRILKALGDQNGGSGGGLLGGLASLLGGGIGGGLLKAIGIGGGAAAGAVLLSRVKAALGLGKAAAAVGAGITGVATATGAERAAGAAANGGRLAAMGRGALGVGKAALGRVMLPITAITSAMESYNTSTEDYAKRLGWEEGESVAKDITARTVGVLSDFGNALTFGLADRIGNWMSGGGFNRSTAPGTTTTTTPSATSTPSGRPNPTAKSEPASAVNGATGTASMDAIQAAIVKLESNGRDDAKAGSSSATGAGQFIDDTWLSMIRRHRPELAQGKSAKELLALRTDGQLSREMVAAYMQDNANHLTGRGLAANAQNLYAAHHFGPQGGVKFARAGDDDLVDSFLSKGQIRANPYLRGLTKAQLTQNWAKRGLPVGAGDTALAAGNAVSQPSAVPLASAARTRAATTPAVVSARSMSGTTATAGPSAAQLQVPPAPSQPVKIGSNGRGQAPVEVIVPQPLTQNLPDRGVANLATGGMGGGMGQRMG